MVTASSWVTISWIVILVGGLMVTGGGFMANYFSREAANERAVQEKAAADEEKAAAVIAERDRFLNSLHFRKLDGYWVKGSNNRYQLGLVATILNKDATRALVFDRVKFAGDFDIVAPPGQGIVIDQMIVGHLKTAEAEGNYYLKAGTETKVRLLLPGWLDVTLTGGIPQIDLTGTWTFEFEGTPFEKRAPTVTMLKVLSADEWQEIEQR